MSAADEVVQENSLREVMAYLSNERWTKILPELGMKVHRIVKRVTGNVDPYNQLKQKYNYMAVELHPGLKNIVEN